MPQHWSQDIDGLYQLEAEYNQRLAEWKELKYGAKANIQAAYDFKQQILAPLAHDFARARNHWRGVGEYTGDRTGVKVEDNKE